MSDIFVSYASADRDRAQILADELTARGWSVWWDRTIPPGQEFDKVIEEALDSAACVVVLWSRTSTASTWVKTEAADAMRRKILVPALIDDTKIPLEFRRLQAADLSDWEPHAEHDEFESFCRSIEANLSGRGEPVLPPPLPQARQPRQPRPQRTDPPPVYAGAPPASASRAKAIVVGVGAALVVVALGGFVVSEYAKRAELETRLETERIERLEEDAARQKAIEDAPAPRTGDEPRREQPVAPTRAARVREEPAKIPIEDVDVEEPEIEPEPRTIELEWNDNSLRYAGTLMWTADEAVLRFTAFDAPTGTPLGQFTFPARPPDGSRYTISGVVPVALDSTTLYPHQHNVNLHFDVARGMPRLIENCQAPGTCFPAR